jgi:hypothetical protein
LDAFCGIRLLFELYYYTMNSLFPKPPLHSVVLQGQHPSTLHELNPAIGRAWNDGRMRSFAYLDYQAGVMVAIVEWRFLS